MEGPYLPRLESWHMRMQPGLRSTMRGIHISAYIRDNHHRNKGSLQCVRARVRQSRTGRDTTAAHAHATESGVPVSHARTHSYAAAMATANSNLLCVANDMYPHRPLPALHMQALLARHALQERESAHLCTPGKKMLKRMTLSQTVSESSTGAKTKTQTW